MLNLWAILMKGTGNRGWSMARPKKPKETVPLWMMTFGDLNSLMMVFFILLFALSTMAATSGPEAVREQLRLISDSFRGSRSASGRSTGPGASAGVPLPGPAGPRARVVAPEPGTRITIGGSAFFDEGSFELREDARARVREILRQVRGYANVVEGVGHASTEPGDAVVSLPDGRGGIAIRPFDPGNPGHESRADRRLLSSLRAQEVARFLTEGDGASFGLPPSRIRIIALADHYGLPDLDPFRTPARAAENRRVGIRLRED